MKFKQKSWWTNDETDAQLAVIKSEEGYASLSETIRQCIKYRFKKSEKKLAS